MKKKIITASILIVLIVLSIPMPIHLKDGGTVEYKALSYKVSKVHRIVEDSENGYENGIIIEIFGIEFYNNVK